MGRGGRCGGGGRAGRGRFRSSRIASASSGDNIVRDAAASSGSSSWSSFAYRGGSHSHPHASMTDAEREKYNSCKDLVCRFEMCGIENHKAKGKDEPSCQEKLENSCGMNDYDIFDN